MSQLLDRDVSQIAFYRRVFEEARDERNPLLERVKFLGILGAGADDFIASTDGGKPELDAMLAEARAYLRSELRPRLQAYGIDFFRYADLKVDERADADRYFADSIEPVLVPLGFDAARPFPHIAGRSIALAVVISRNGDEHFACVEIPLSLPPFVTLDATGRRRFVWLHEVVAANLGSILPGASRLDVYPFRIVRDNR